MKEKIELDLAVAEDVTLGHLVLVTKIIRALGQNPTGNRYAVASLKDMYEDIAFQLANNC